jgi:predicted dithiol-disulfide oxidoreductase (DUF899 family)
MALPEVVSREEWLTARLQLLDAEKAHVRAHDELNAERRRLPMVKVIKDYRFEGPDGMVGLADLFDGSHQLIVQHVMFGPDWDNPCPSCSAYLRTVTPEILKNLKQRDTAYVLMSRAPYEKIAKVQAERDIPIPWYSSFGSDFNFDFGVSFDPAVMPPVYNYKPAPEADTSDEGPGFSCFLRDGADIYHTYSTFGRGTEGTVSAYVLLDMTALGRSEAWEEPKYRALNTHPADPSFTA